MRTYELTLSERNNLIDSLSDHIINLERLIIASEEIGLNVDDIKEKLSQSCDLRKKIIG